MKRLVFCLVCALLCSCDPEWAFDPPYSNHLVMQNNSSQELVVFVTINKVKKDGQVLSLEHRYRLHVGDMCLVNGNHNNPEGVSQEELFALLISNVSNIKITNADDSVIFREFDVNSSGVQHNPYKESSWEYEEYTEPASEYYDQLFKMWYYTITDADLVVTE